MYTRPGQLTIRISTTKRSSSWTPEVGLKKEKKNNDQRLSHAPILFYFIPLCHAKKKTHYKKDKKSYKFQTNVGLINRVDT